VTSITPGTGKEIALLPDRGGPARPAEVNQDDCPDPIELILYVSAESPRSTIAIEQIKAMLNRQKSRRVKLTIYDLAKEPNENDEEIVPTPAAGYRSGPRTFILGHITNPDLLLEMLADCWRRLSPSRR
jgi:hypothetical protein